MLKFKKLMIAACGLALTLSATIASASANNIELLTGSKYIAASKVTSLKLNVSDLATSASDSEGFTSNGFVMVKLEKGVFNSTTVGKTELGTNGLHCTDIFGGVVVPTWNIGINTSASTEYDILNIGWSSDNALYTPNGDIIEVMLLYSGAPVETSMTILPVQYMGEGVDDQKTVLTICDANANVVSKNIAFAENKNTYTLAADSATVTKTEPSAGPTKKVEVAGYFTGDKDEDGDEKDTADVTAAIYAQLIPADANTVYTKVNWSVTATEDGTANSAAKTQEYEQTGLDLSGEAAYKVGLVIRGLAANVITAVDAALAQ